MNHLNSPSAPLRLLTIAGSDPTGGAGVQADLQVFHSFAAYGLSVITALSAQNTHGVHALYPVRPDAVRTQLDRLLNDIAIDGIKIGMLGNETIVEAVFTTLADYPTKHIVLDPVMIASSGYPLLSDAGIAALLDYLPQCTVLTPNSEELLRLTPTECIIAAKQDAIDSTEQTRATWLAAHTNTRVVVTGGHSQRHQITIAQPTGALSVVPFVHRDTQHTHGTGCVFSSALLGFMAQGYDLRAACCAAVTYLDEALVGAINHPLQAEGKSPVRIPQHYRKPCGDSHIIAS